MKKTGTIIFLTLIATSCMRQSGHHMLSNVPLDHYKTSSCAKWITVSPTAEGISVFGFFAFDTNYRFLKCTLGQVETNLANLIFHSLELQPRKTNETLILVQDAHISSEGFEKLFCSVPTSQPSWWETDFSRFDIQAFCVWQSTNNYGYGYVYLLDSDRKELMAFQWSQQWSTVDRTMGLLNTSGKSRQIRVILDK